jgi:hypothetical protein
MDAVHCSVVGNTAIKPNKPQLKDAPESCKACTLYETSRETLYESASHETIRDPCASAASYHPGGYMSRDL